jgi:hypothetical protein
MTERRISSEENAVAGTRDYEGIADNILNMFVQ